MLMTQLSPDSLNYDCFREAILTKRSNINPKIVKDCESMFSSKARKRSRDYVIELNQSVDDVSMIETSSCRANKIKIHTGI